MFKFTRKNRLLQAVSITAVIVLTVLCIIVLIEGHMPSAYVRLRSSPWPLLNYIAFGCATLGLVLIAGLSMLYIAKHKTYKELSEQIPPGIDIQTQKDMQIKYYERSTHYQEELRRYRHDYKNHILILSAFLKSNDIESALKHLDLMGATLRNDTNIVRTENPAIDILISEKLISAHEMGIRIHHMIGLSPDIKVDTADFCLAMSCCLDNALEACQASKTSLPKGETPFIELHIIEQHGVIVFKMTNTSLAKEVKEGDWRSFTTTKSDTKDHGFGLVNLADIVAKYDGYLHLQQKEEGVFVTNFTLFTNSERDEHSFTTKNC